jgi:hypothetical protein
MRDAFAVPLLLAMDTFATRAGPELPDFVAVKGRRPAPLAAAAGDFVTSNTSPLW